MRERAVGKERWIERVVVYISIITRGKGEGGCTVITEFEERL